MALGITSDNDVNLISRHEVKCSLEDVIRVSSGLLNSKGSLYIVHRPERLVDLFVLMRKYNLEPKVLQYIEPFSNAAPNLVLIKAVKNGNSFLKVLPPLVMYNNDNSYTKELLKIYGKEV